MCCYSLLQQDKQNNRYTHKKAEELMITVRDNIKKAQGKTLLKKSFQKAESMVIGFSEMKNMLLILPQVSLLCFEML